MGSRGTEIAKWAGVDFGEKNHQKTVKHGQKSKDNVIESAFKGNWEEKPKAFSILDKEILSGKQFCFIKKKKTSRQSLNNVGL